MLSESQSFADSGIPALSAVLDPRELRKYLCRVLPAQWGVVQDIRIQVLRHHRASRCAVDIKLQTTTGRHGLIGKVYAEDRSDVYQVMKRICQSGFGHEEEFSIPQPFAYLPQLQLLLQEKVDGPSAKEIFLTGNESERARAAERCACWLAHFHTRAPRLGPVFGFTHELGEFWMRRLAKRSAPQTGPLSEKVMLLLKRLKSAAAALDRAERCAGQGAYRPSQMILTATRTVTFDWDSYCVADPAWDVAKFIFRLHQLALESRGSRNALDADIEAFYETYTTRSRFEVAKHLPFYEAAHCLKHTRSLLRRRNGGIERAEAILDEGLRVLAE